MPGVATDLGCFWSILMGASCDAHRGSQWVWAYRATKPVPVLVMSLQALTSLHVTTIRDILMRMVG